MFIATEALWSYRVHVLSQYLGFRYIVCPKSSLSSNRKVNLSVCYEGYTGEVEV
jgi:hypothetical protein